ncbi:MAG: hypothetical protein HZB76_00415 [Chlamydiae bacterium]|nr:hypothetical protein [Chlamydiota bacterium]
MSSQVLFNPDIFRTYETFQAFMSGEDVIKAIKSQTATFVNTQTTLSKKIIMVIVSSFSLIASVFLYICSYPLSLVRANNLSTRCKLLSNYFLDYCTCINNIILYFGKDLLVFANNDHDLSTSDLYLAKKVERKSISKDERLIKLIYSNMLESWKEKQYLPVDMLEFNENFTEVNFANLEGICFGMSVWFSYLYLNSYQLTQDPLKHIQVVAKQFENGAPRQAGLLQSLFCQLNLDNSLPTLLKLKNKKPICLDSIKSWKFYNFLNKNQDGVYLLRILKIGDHGHAMCYIKQNDHKYIFDPNVGLVKIDDEKTFQAFYDSQIKGKFNSVEISKLMKEAPLIQVPKKPSEAPQGILFKIAGKISRFFSKKAA